MTRESIYKEYSILPTRVIKMAELCNILSCLVDNLGNCCEAVGGCCEAEYIDASKNCTCCFSNVQLTDGQQPCLDAWFRCWFVRSSCGVCSRQCSSLLPLLLLLLRRVRSEKAKKAYGDTGSCTTSAVYVQSGRVDCFLFAQKNKKNKKKTKRKQ